MRRVLVWLLWQTDTWGSILAVRLVRWTGKSSYAIHPKHLLDAQWQRWYLAHIGPGDLVLDAGCGNAVHSVLCAAHCQGVHGFDRDTAQLAIGRRRARDAKAGNIVLAVGDVGQGWGYESGRFDKVMLLDVLEHVWERDRALHEALRVMQPDGALLISVPRRDTRWKRLRASVGLPAYADPDHKVEYTLEEIQEELARNGFACEAVEPVVCDTFLAGPIDAIGGLSLWLYRRLVRWKREMALANPAESTGFRIVARRRPGP